MEMNGTVAAFCLGLEEVGTQQRSLRGHQVGEWCSGRRRRAAPMGAGAGPGSALHTCGERCCLSILCSCPGVRDRRVLLGFGGRRAAQVVPPPSAFGAAVKAEWHREKQGKGRQRSSLHGIKNNVFCSRPRRCVCLVNQKNICVLLFQPAHQQTAARPSVFLCTEVAQMDPAGRRCPSSPPPALPSPAPGRLFTRSLLRFTAK